MRMLNFFMRGNDDTHPIDAMFEQLYCIAFLLFIILLIVVLAYLYYNHNWRPFKKIFKGSNTCPECGEPLDFKGESCKKCGTIIQHEERGSKDPLKGNIGGRSKRIDGRKKVFIKIATLIILAVLWILALTGILRIGRTGFWILLGATALIIMLISGYGKGNLKHIDDSFMRNI